MSTFTFTLGQKTERFELSPSGHEQKLTFSISFPKNERLTNQHGERVERGYVEIVMRNPKFETPTLVLSSSGEDADTGKTYPPSISFYAKVPEELFQSLKNAPAAAIYTLNVSTELMGAISFADALGFEKIWDTAQQNPVNISFFDFSIQHVPEGLQ